ncbi:hypothetical protein GCM10023194_49660 [Planotetraspora phitsanulokensis]|uniref:AMP-dependent synthetase/ligase domain-containing protein n=1 Tax=Planotetraspora phitsanulokensis TaxID=575192 RepID=A0A8J3U2D6_9ACTN|nr:hypothetical protein [Planotetraspora phitsanulokensis]GII36955.1 hypothetical protein Pph01_19580 [Planotetraspora phitsanulokensis]
MNSALRTGPDAGYALHADGTRVDRLADIVRRRAAATPDLPAVIEPGRTITHADLDARSSRVAQALLADGVRATGSPTSASTPPRSSRSCTARPRSARSPPR